MLSIRAETPQARSVRSIGNRCSKARPIAELTMNRPTKNNSRPNAVRLRWKLSVEAFEVGLRRPGSTRRRLSPATLSSVRARLAFGFADQEARDLVRQLEDLLCDADIDDQHAGRQAPAARAAAAACIAVGLRCSRPP